MSVPLLFVSSQRTSLTSPRCPCGALTASLQKSLGADDRRQSKTVKG
ncbi:hypothetical protein [European catfish virus]|uniref:Uncharacterized protein n=1 Tax=European catfish virus TaxID=84739 RepID=I2BFQ5_9VIRU|nr:hypothetical protein A190_gp075 [European catfish virus]AFJ52358.1 hypothetical protein [European catfish virus]AMZ04904.1 hypothetical protein [European catfish virus]AMZ05040.1 hypothetical protein [European catfish virus]